ncbi:MAG TPA: metal-dependent hydrolase [Vicinamibacterales bacterium]|nr:metal-dependent hydrolase [Vicinamibacterales bacterium]
MSALSITWFGHATFVVTTPGGKRIVFDPWLTGNPKAPAGAKIDKADVICVTHGHSDHTADVVATARATGAPVLAMFELANWFSAKGVKDVVGMGIGGTATVKDLRISMTEAVHSSSIDDNGNFLYAGLATGFVVRMEDNRSLYFAGDTALFGDMRLIRELYSPEIAFLPIGDHYTMGPVGAAKACELLGVRQVVPMHYGTFPALTGTPDELKRLVEPMGIDVLVLKPGETAQ